MFYCCQTVHTYLHSDGVIRDKTCNEENQYTGYFKTMEDAKKAVDKYYELRESDQKENKGETMNKREAIKAMCDGKKVRQSHWGNEYIQIDEYDNIVDELGNLFDLNKNDNINNWEIYNEYSLDVYEAFKAVLDGKKVQHESWDDGEYIEMVGYQVEDEKCTMFVSWGNPAYQTGWKIIE
jgi:hypothetical protein